MIFLYNAGIRLLVAFFSIGQHFNKKLKQGYDGRQDWEPKLKKFRAENPESLVWFHCASLGEFEMARPVIDLLNENKPKTLSIVITFFSPSGYEQRKNYKGIDFAMYLPFDTQKSAIAFIEILRPSVAVFVKYEFWLNYLKQLENRKVKNLLINGLFREDHIFFKPWGGIFRSALKSIDHLFLQNNKSAKLLFGKGISHTTVTGDLRYDRVTAISKNTRNFDQLETFIKGAFIVIGGSTWPEEEKILLNAVKTFKKQIKLILVPHDISEAHLQQIEKQLSGMYFKRFSTMKAEHNPQIILVDTIGHLSSLYKLGDLALVGGGFTGALHNILEPAVFGIPVLFGSTYNKFPEAGYFVEKGLSASINSSKDFENYLNDFMSSPEKKEKIKTISESVFKANSGGTEQVYYKIKGFLSGEINY